MLAKEAFYYTLRFQARGKGEPYRHTLDISWVLLAIHIYIYIYVYISIFGSIGVGKSSYWFLGAQSNENENITKSNKNNAKSAQLVQQSIPNRFEASGGLWGHRLVGFSTPNKNHHCLLFGAFGRHLVDSWNNL